MNLPKLEYFHSLYARAEQAATNTFESIVAKRGTGKETGNVQMVVNIFNGFLEIERWDLVLIFNPKRRLACQ